jgi:hypothetical protein
MEWRHNDSDEELVEYDGPLDIAHVVDAELLALVESDSTAALTKVKSASNTSARQSPLLQPALSLERIELKVNIDISHKSQANRSTDIRPKRMEGRKVGSQKYTTVCRTC